MTRSLRSTTKGATTKAPARTGRFSEKARERIRAIARKAAAYYCTAGRSFPWRDVRDPYRLAVAEILLQKTRAASVVGTYERLIIEYPTEELLARADRDHIVEILTPLGLSKKRATQLLGMASAVASHGKSIFNDWKLVLAEVPGLGAYGARAIACFGGGEPVGIVDANVARILRRVFALHQNDSRAIIFQRYADALASSGDAVEVNFGLLDIGAQICLTRPKCDCCPLLDHCAYGTRRRRLA